MIVGNPVATSLMCEPLPPLTRWYPMRAYPMRAEVPDGHCHGVSGPCHEPANSASRSTARMRHPGRRRARRSSNDDSGGISGTASDDVPVRSRFRPGLLRRPSPAAPALCHRTGRLSLGGVAPRWRWLLVTLAALAVSCVVPGSMLSQPPPAGRAAMVTALAPAPSGSECAAVSCNRGSPSSTVPLPSVSLAGTIAAGMLVILALFAVLRARRRTGSLPAGTPSPLLRPPQHLVCA